MGTSKKHKTMDDLADYRAKMAAKYAAEPKRDTSKDSDWPSGPKMKQIFGDKIYDKPGHSVETEKALAGKIVGVYFSAHWCPPCRGFTPVLADFYRKAQASGKKFAIVFCSSDKDAASHNAYFSEMPWYSLSFGNKHIKPLATQFGVSGIPSLIILDKNGKEITRDGRGDVTKGLSTAFAKWSK